MRAFLRLLILSTLLLSAVPLQAEESCEGHYLPEVSPKALQARRELERLCPHLTTEQIQEKLAAIPHCFMFYRSFVALFYHAIESSPRHNELFAPLRKYRGWLFGDVHPENFGAVLDHDGLPVFMVNDWDDGLRGALYYDFLRFLTSIRVSRTSHHPEELIKAYRKGLAGKDLEPSDYISSLIKKAEENGRRAKSSMIDETGKKLKRDSTMSEVSDQERSQIEKVLERSYGQEFKFRDAVRVKRAYGGSGGMDRLLVLLKAKGDLRDSIDGKKLILEFKELALSGASAVAEGGPKTPRGRMTASIRAFPEHNASDIYEVRRLEGKDYLIRPRWAGNIGVKLNEIPEDQVLDAFKYEAYTLGRLHRENADNPDVYRQAFKEFPDQVLIDESNRVAREFRSFFKDVR